MKASTETEVYSIWRCALCRVIKTRPHKEALTEAKRRGWDVEKMGVAGQNMNSPTCPYTYVKIDDQFYKRGTGNIHDNMKREEDYEGESCHDCGVIYGNIHHIECDMERCPVPDCGDQFLSCPHNIEAVYYKGLGDNKGTPFTSSIWDAFNKRVERASMNEDGICSCRGQEDGCQFQYVEFAKGERLARDKGCVHDWSEEFKMNPWTCAGCGARYGKTHHTECDDEKCPKCHGQLFGCECGDYRYVLRNGRN